MTPRDELAALLDGALCLEEVADELGVSTRTLRDRLKAAGVSIPEGTPESWRGVRRALLNSYLDWVEERRLARLSDEQRRTMTYARQARAIGIPLDDVMRAQTRARNRNPGSSPRRWGKGDEPLTSDERTLLEDLGEIMATGSTMRDAAGRLGLSERTLQRLKKRQREAGQ